MLINNNPQAAAHFLSQNPVVANVGTSDAVLVKCLKALNFPLSKLSLLGSSRSAALIPLQPYLLECVEVHSMKARVASTQDLL